MKLSEQRLLLQLPEELKDRVRTEAKRKNLSLNALIRLAITEWLDREQVESPASPESRTGQAKKRSHKGGK